MIKDFKFFLNLRQRRTSWVATQHLCLLTYHQQLQPTCDLSADSTCEASRPLASFYEMWPRLNTQSCSFRLPGAPACQSRTCVEKVRLDFTLKGLSYVNFWKELTIVRRWFKSKEKLSLHIAWEKWKLLDRCHEALRGKIPEMFTVMVRVCENGLWKCSSDHMLAEDSNKHLLE